MAKDRAEGRLRLSWYEVPGPKGRGSSGSPDRASQGQEGGLRALAVSTFVLGFCGRKQHKFSLFVCLFVF